jgi:general secretion pathway protein M
MLLAMCVALGAFAWWYGLLVPLRNLREHAHARYDHAAAEWLAVRDAAAAIRELSAGGPHGAAALATEVLAAAETAGVAVSRQRPQAQAKLAVGIDAVDAPHLLAWLDTLQRERRVGVERVRIEKRDGRLQADIVFRPVAETAR